MVHKVIPAIVESLSRKRIPGPLRPLIFKSYSKIFDVNLRELNRPITDYENLIDFFTRDVKRKADEVEPLFPSDGILRHFGNVKEGVFRIKGYTYRLSDFLPSTEESLFKDGVYWIFHLRPGDYHRVHSPVCGRIFNYCFFPGKVYPVNRIGERFVCGLYRKNARLSILMDTKDYGKVSIVMIGAFNVGVIDSVCGLFDAKKDLFTDWQSIDIRVKAGDWIGTFYLGSTVLLLMERGYDCLIKKEGRKVSALASMREGNQNKEE